MAVLVAEEAGERSVGVGANVDIEKAVGCGVTVGSDIPLPQPAKDNNRARRISGSFFIDTKL